MKKAKYLGSGWVFSSDKFGLAIFDGIFLIPFKRYSCHEFKFGKIFHLWSIFVKLKDSRFANLEQLTRDIVRSINA